MKNLFIPYSLSVLLKNEYKFEEPCLGYYVENNKTLFIGNGHNISNVIPAPTHQQVVDWLREIHNIHVLVSYKTYLIKSCNGYYYTFNWTGSEPHSWFGNFETYYEAFEKGIYGAVISKI